MGQKLGDLRFFQMKKGGTAILVVNQIMGGPEIEEVASMNFKTSLIIDEEKSKKKSDLHKLHL